MKDWTSHSLAAHDHFKAVDRLLTDYPSAQPLDNATKAEICGHLHICIYELSRIEAWVRAH